ncbi:MAG: hypothetical protein MK101_08890 [Phycisphaerales bacterium]|nr:hypothetical protein [Phycisphaerales bacterium]
MRIDTIMWQLVISLLLTLAPSAMARQDAVLSAQDASRLSIFKLTLLGDVGGVDAATRTAAAGELLRLDHPAAQTVLAEGISTGRAHVMRAVFMALAEAPAGQGALLDLAHDTLVQVPDEASESLAILLARAAAVDPSVITRLHLQASDPDAPDDARTAAIAVLGESRHTPVEAAAALVSLLEHQQVQTPAVLKSTTDALARLTGLPPDDQVQTWQLWWSANRDRPAERWLADMVQALSRRVADLEHRQADASTREQALAQRLVDAHRRLWPLLSAEEQAARLGELLADDLPALRQFGVERAAVLVRDGNATPQTDEAVLARLDDPDEQVRLAVARLLPELPQALVHERVASRLSLESSHTVAAALLDVLASHPTMPVELDLLTGHLTRSSTRGPAAEAIWVRTSTMPEGEAHAQLLEAIAAARLADGGSDLDHLAAALGDDAAATAIEPHLDSEDAYLRRRTAEAFRRRGDGDRILPRADDPAVFPVVLEVLRAREGRAAFDPILALTPDETHQDTWTAALLQAAAATPLTDRAQIDVLLEATEGIDAQHRIDLLIPAVAPEQSIDVRLTAADRLVPLLGAAGQDRALIALVDALPQEHRPEGLDEAAFVAALRSRQFDTAAQMRPAPRSWVAAFESIKRGRPELADLVRTEIVRRFQDDLEDALRARLGMASDPLMGDATDTPEG